MYKVILASLSYIFSSAINYNHNVLADSAFDNSSSFQDTTRVSKWLCEYAIDSCLEGLLETVVDQDRKVFLFDSTIAFYSLTFEKRQKYNYLKILVDRWDKTIMLDYVGIVKVQNVNFLIRGDVDSNDIFQKLATTPEKFNFAKPKIFSADSLDLIYNPSLLEPPFFGTIYSCPGLPIFVEIFIRGDLDHLRRTNKSAQ